MIANKDRVQIANSAKHAIKLLGMPKDEFADILLECVVDGHFGIYSGKVFAERYLKGFEEKHNLDSRIVSDLLNGPKSGTDSLEDYYFDALESLHYVEIEEYRLHIGESGDYFLYDSNLLELWERLNNCEFFADF